MLLFGLQAGYNMDSACARIKYIHIGMIIDNDAAHLLSLQVSRTAKEMLINAQF